MDALFCILTIPEYAAGAYQDIDNCPEGYGPIGPAYSGGGVAECQDAAVALGLWAGDDDGVVEESEAQHRRCNQGWSGPIKLTVPGASGTLLCKANSSAVWHSLASYISCVLDTIAGWLVVF